MTLRALIAMVVAIVGIAPHAQSSATGPRWVHDTTSAAGVALASDDWVRTNLSCRPAA